MILQRIWPVCYLRYTTDRELSISELYIISSDYVENRKFGNNDCTDFAIVSGILRLANKYLIDSLQARALEHLSIAWPSTLKAWDAREDLAGEYYVDSDGPRFYPSPVVSSSRLFSNADFRPKLTSLS